MDRSRIPPYVRAFVVALLLTALACAALIPFRDVLDSGEIALFFALVVWGAAALAGVWAGMLAAVASFAALVYFFMAPYYHLSAARPADWLTLVVFVIVAGIEGWQTGRLRERENRAIQGEREAEALATLTAELVSQSSASVMGDIVASEAARATGARHAAVIVRDEAGTLVPMTTSSGAEDLADAGIERFSRWVIEHGTAVGLPALTEVTAEEAASPGERLAAAQWPSSVSHDAVVPGARRDDVFLPLTTPGGVEGVLYIAPLPHRRALTQREAQLAVSLSRLVGAFLERRRLERIATQAESLREGDRLKSTLVSSVSHELKTPLAAMTATVSGLLATDAEPDVERMRRDLAVVDEGLQRLSTSIADLLDLSRLESDSWEPRRESYEIGEIVGSLLGRISAADRARISLQIPEGLPTIEVDFVQLSRALSNLVENALDYSGCDGSVAIGARAVEGAVETWVEDDGPGIAESERERVFDKFYRGSAAQRVPSGTGLGLTIAQEIVRFNGGTIHVEAAYPHGARFVVSVPASRTPDDEEG